MNREEFNKLAVETYGDKVSVKPISVSDENLEKLNEYARGKGLNTVTREDIENYPQQVWVMNGECPKCGSTLSGLFGSFSWGMVHGEGQCTCGAAFRSVHFFKEGSPAITTFALIGF